MHFIRQNNFIQALSVCLLKYYIHKKLKGEKLTNNYTNVQGVFLNCASIGISDTVRFIK